MALRLLFCLAILASLSSCASVRWVNAKDPSRDSIADWQKCESTHFTKLGTVHCMRSLGWDGEPE